MQTVLKKRRSSEPGLAVAAAVAPAPDRAEPGDVRTAYTTSRRALYALVAAVAAVLIAGFWNYHLVDGFGRDVIAGSTIGDTSAFAGGYLQYGTGFGFLFAVIAGLAATFTACNCVVFAMIPGLACGSTR